MIRLVLVAKRWVKTGLDLSQVFVSAVFVLAMSGSGDCDAESNLGAVQKVAFKPLNSAIAVIYTDLGEPYRTIFLQIIEGIEDKVDGRVNAYPVGQNANLQDLKSRLSQQDARVVIALGRQGMKTAENLDAGFGVVAGGVVASAENETARFPVNSLSPDPALMFSQLREFMPAVRRVFTVYDSRQSGWLIELANQAARKQGLELVGLKAEDLRTAVGLYRDIFNSADGRRDALWLLQDATTVEDGSVLPMVLQESWDRNITVFSSNPGHVRRGVLFSLYPDNMLLGRRLATEAQAFLTTGGYSERGTILLRDVQTVINSRTAQHLQIDLGSRQFGMVFPKR